MSEYERLHDFTRLLANVAEALRLKGRADAAYMMHAEAVHFANERDIARAVAEAAEELDNPIESVDLGRLDD